MRRFKRTYERSVMTAANQHKPVEEEVLVYDCMVGNCDHEDECPFETVLCCSYCLWLNREINDELIIDEVLAQNCPVCSACYPDPRQVTTAQEAPK